MGAVQPLVDELLALAVVLLLVARDFLIGLGNAQPRQSAVIKEDVVLVVDFLDDQVRNDVRIVGGRILQAGLRIETRQLVRGTLHLVRRQPKALAQVAPTVRDQVVERVFDQPVH